MIGTGLIHSYALTKDLKVQCWGDNSYKQCNVPKDVQGNTLMLCRTNGSFTIVMTQDIN